MIKSSKRCAVLLTALLLASTASAWAQSVGTGFTYQGQIQVQGQPVNGTADLTFRLMDAASGGTKLGSDIAFTNIQVVDGVFTVILNQSGQFGANAFTGNARWLEIDARSPAGGGVFTTLAPRQALTATPFALYALNGGAAGSDPWIVSGSIIHYDAGNVGIGTATPASRLHVSGGGGDVRVDVGSSTNDTSALTLVGARSSATPQFVGINLNNFDSNGSSGAEYSGAFIRSYNELGNDSGNLTLWTKATADAAPLERLRIAAAGNVGIGTVTPQAPLSMADVVGDKIALYGQTANHYGIGVQSNLLQIHSNTSNSDVAFGYGSSAAFTETMRIKGSGNVGIGNASPSYQLDVTGATQSALRLDSADTIGTRLRLSSSATGGRIYDMVSTANGNASSGGKWLLVDNTAALTRMTVDSSGNVGVGNSAPSYQLDVTGATQSALRLDSADTIGTRLRLSNSATGGRIYDLVSTADGNANGGGKWLLVDSTASVPRVAVASSGDVGIGTTAPAVRLDVLDTTASDNSAAVRGIHTQGTFGIGVEGDGGHIGVSGSVQNIATSGSPSCYGLLAAASSGAFGTNYGLYASAAGGALAYAGYFSGNVNVAGTLSKSAGAFKIDHPLDPANKYLWHSFVESPDMMNVYNGNVVTDTNGFATVQLPDWFEALNRDFRYQLTTIGSFARVMVAQEVQSNAFVIRSESPNVRVSWQITGIRHDAYAAAHPIPVEQVKPDFEKGSYIHPTLFGQPEALRVDLFHDAENADAAVTSTGNER